MIPFFEMNHHHTEITKLKAMLGSANALNTADKWLPWARLVDLYEWPMVLKAVEALPPEKNDGFPGRSPRATEQLCIIWTKQNKEIEKEVVLAKKRVEGVRVFTREDRAQQSKLFTDIRKANGLL
jgi:hypothetical protein